MPRLSRYQSENAAQRRRLEELVAKLNESQLSQSMPGGWTAALKLAHLAYWDQYALARLKKWERSGFESVTVPVDEVNEAVRAVSRAIAPREAAALALASAEAVDAQVEKLGAELMEQIESSGNVRMVNRSLHRRLHVDEIEQALALRKSSPGKA